MTAAAAVKHRREQARLVTVFQKFCEEHAFNPRSPTLVSVGAFLVIRTRSLQGSSKTIRAVIGAIRRHCVLNSVPYLTADEQLLLEDLVKELEFGDTKSTHRVRPLSRLMLDLLYNKERSCGAREQMALVMMTLAHDGMLRAGEVCSKLRILDIAWNKDRSSCTIHLLRTKTRRKAGGVYVTLFNYGRRSGCALLDEWIRAKELRGESPDAYLFPHWDERRQAFDSTRVISTDAFRKMIKKAVSSIGLDPTMFSGHSCRAGGATDAFNEGVPYAVVKKFGRWKSDIVLIYYRDEDEVASRISEAFKFMGKNKNGLFRRVNKARRSAK